MKLIFISEGDFTLNTLEYNALWKSYSDIIQESFKIITGLEFKEENIIAHVGNYQSNFAGNSIKDSMLFRNTVRHKLGTIFHELSHRLLVEYSFIYTNIVENDHELIDLFLYDVMTLAFGESAAVERMSYEMTFPESEIPNAWNKIMKYSIEDRKELLNKIKEQSGF